MCMYLQRKLLLSFVDQFYEVALLLSCVLLMLCFLTLYSAEAIIVPH